MISPITIQGTVRFVLYRETMTGPVLIRFMSRLLKDVQRKVFLIPDTLRVHHRKVVKKGLDEHQQWIEIF